MFERLKSVIRQNPLASLEYLFWQYRITDKTNLLQVKRLFQELPSDCYLSYVLFINNLCPGKLVALEKNISDILISSLEYAVENCKIRRISQKFTFPGKN